MHFGDPLSVRVCMRYMVHSKPLTLDCTRYANVEAIFRKYFNEMWVLAEKQFLVCSDWSWTPSCCYGKVASVGGKCSVPNSGCHGAK